MSEHIDSTVAGLMNEDIGSTVVGLMNEDTCKFYTHIFRKERSTYLHTKQRRSFQMADIEDMAEAKF
jgi:hypothetical protein